MQGTAAVAAIGAGPFLQGFRAPLFVMVLAAVVAALATPWVMRLAVRHGAIDDPTRDDRRVHTQPTPRWGGLAIFIGILAPLALLPYWYKFNPFPPYLIAMLIGGALIVAVGMFDDVKPLNAKVQAGFLLLLGVAIQFVYDPIGRIKITGISTPLLTTQGEWVPFGIWAIPITAIYIFVVTKTMDTLDGIDGLTAGIAAITGATLALIAAVQGQPRVALVAAAVCGASLGFLRFNYHPAKIFMGTGGAQMLGFFLACLSIVGAFKTAAAVAIVVPLLAFGVPILDAVNVIVRRILGRQPITQADKRHLHHALLGKGLNQRQAVWVLYVAALGLAGVLLVLVRKFG